MLTNVSVFDTTSAAAAISRDYGEIGYANRDKRDIHDETYAEMCEFFDNGGTLMRGNHIAITRCMTSLGEQLVVLTHDAAAVVGTWGARQIWHEYQTGKLTALAV